MHFASSQDSQAYNGYTGWAKKAGLLISAIQLHVYNYPPVANFLLCECAKNYANWLAVDKVIARIIRLTFWPTLYIRTYQYDSGFLIKQHKT